MKTIKIRKSVKNELHKMAVDNDCTLNDIVKTILDQADKHYPSAHDSDEKANINTSDDTFELLKDCKYVYDESHSSTLERVLQEYRDS